MKESDKNILEMRIKTELEGVEEICYTYNKPPSASDGHYHPGSCLVIWSFRLPDPGFAPMPLPCIGVVHTPQLGSLRACSVCKTAPVLKKWSNTVSVNS